VKKILCLTQISLFLVFAAASAPAQSADDLKTKYGEPFKAYEIRPGIMMTVKFDERGQVSEMRIGPHAATDETVHLDATIPSYLLKEIVDEVAPVSERGAKGAGFGSTIIVGGGGTVLENYENVDMTYYINSSSKECGGTVAVVIKWKNRSHH
jgi:hypothetical protein